MRDTGAAHATDDSPAVRNEVYRLIAPGAFRIDATAFEKRKAMPHLHSELGLYKIAWFLHFRYIARHIVSRSDRLLVVAAQIGTKRRRGAFHNAVDDVVQQVNPCRAYRVAFWPSPSDPCLWLADYCTWALQRDWELGDATALNLVRRNVTSNMDMWSWGTKYYY